MSSIADDNFTGNNEDIPNSDKWSRSGQTIPVIYNNALRTTAQGMDASATVYSVYVLIGDFDIQVDFDLPDYSSTSDWSATLYVKTANNWRFYAMREYVGAHRYRFLEYNNSTWNTVATVSTSHTSGKLRLTRVSNYFHAYFWNGTGWAQIGSGSSYTDSADCVVYLSSQSKAANYPLITTDYDNFIVNSGTVSIEMIDTRLNLQAATWTTSDLKTFLHAHDGLEFEDIALALKTLGLELEDLKTFLSAHYRSEADVRMFLKALAILRNDIPLSFKAFGQGLENIRFAASTVKSFRNDIRMMLEAVSPTILNDIALFLAATDGSILNDIRLRLNAVKRPPQYRSNIAQRLSAVISEVA